MDIAQLNERSKEIFKHIVETYLETGDPVGSRTISKVGGIDLSAATIRNVMADLEQSGLLISPHTSAGRIPTDTGLRLFVDGMMEVGNLTHSERESIQGTCAATGRVFEDILSDATKALSGLSKCTSLVMVPKHDQTIQHIEFVSIAPDKALVILVGQNGTVENRVINLPAGLPPSTLVQASNYLNARLAGKNIDDVKNQIAYELSARQAELDGLTSKVVEEGLAVWAGNDVGSPASLIVSGQANLLENLEAAEDLDRIRGLFDELEQKKELIRLLDLAKDGRGVRMFIGAENNLFSLSGSSLVVSPYMNGANKVVGVIGVIGPTRLNYARIIPMVDYTAQVVGRLL
ncbi:heat-inducible transcriptional repressor HrcA [Kordiimonas sp. SCSIO 12610]|uniref:heat-inducible transcriptional repressor HrcA n=1 Tax=Kordiimonas sp. SCSIO 12610 TaxID=2829597 RepID=UPI00210ED361|nr:heat-inducible transcriptional repressor HrcA [Kordiimonas sp. SCSIO 12610]UTW55488.1 heat-inducible transcriptional repressor HrcA [Kordiimonas sp. SCSIO 12610]